MSRAGPTYRIAPFITLDVTGPRHSGGTTWVEYLFAGSAGPRRTRRKTYPCGVTDRSGAARKPRRQGVLGRSNCWRAVQAAIWARVAKPSLDRMLATCPSTVRSLITNSDAI